MVGAMSGNFLKRCKSVLGILLILLSLAGLMFWEMKGREMVMTDTVLVAKQEIPKGTIVNQSMFTVKGITKSNLLQKALGPEDLESLQGRMSAQLIAQNGQIIPEYFQKKELYLENDESVFVIKPEWIAMRSSALRRGDIIDLYGENGIGFLGNYRIAYVKDEAEREVVDAVEATGKNTTGGILERADSTSVIDHIEIITTLSEYERLKASIEGATGATPAALIIVQRENPQIVTGKETD
jgi:hypothetical protein